MWRYFIWLIAIVGLIIILIILLIPGGKKLTTAKSLYSYANTDASASLTIDGPINSDEKHSAFKISVDRNTVTFDQYQGYEGHVVKQQTYPNNQSAYNNFLHALYHSGFTLGNTSNSLKDELGYCPLGDRFVYKFVDGDNQIERFWATSCNGRKTFNGNIGLVNTLFKNQVPDYSSLSSHLNL